MTGGAEAELPPLPLALFSPAVVGFTPVLTSTDLMGGVPLLHPITLTAKIAIAVITSVCFN
jgi:hypothetical protein